jgi:hypothetical protein
MRSCSACGWDIAPGATTCAACRRQQQATASRAQQAQLISTVLTRARRPTSESTDSGPASPPDGESVILREVGGASDAPRAARPGDQAPAQIVSSLRQLLGSPAPSEDDPEPPEPVTQDPPQPALAAEDSTPRFVVTFHDLGGWTAVAKLALLCSGLLSSLQVLVLLMVAGALAATSAGDTADAARGLAAYTKVIRVMLPSLLVLTLAAISFAAWRSVLDRAAAGDVPRKRLLSGVSLPLWTVFGSAVALLVVLLGAYSSEGAGALRATQWAIVACALLGVACFVGPRGLRTTDQNQHEVSRSRSASDPPAKALPAGSGSQSAA